VAGRRFAVAAEHRDFHAAGIEGRA
jgi:hypothetical protein